MALTWLHAGTSETFDLSAWGGSFGTVTSDSSVVHGQPRSLKLASTYANVYREGIVADAGFRLSVWVQVSAWPTDTTEGVGLFAIYDAGGAHGNANLRIQPGTGVLQCNLGTANAAFPNGTGTHAVSTGTWMRISWAGTYTSEFVNHFKVWINGTLEIDAENGDMSFGGLSRLYCGAGSNSTTYFSDFYVDGDASLTDPGDMRVTAKLPTTANANNFDTSIGDGTVNNRALDEAKGMQHANSTQVAQNYAIETAAGGDVDVSTSTIVGYQAWIWAKATAVSGTPKITRNGTDVAITLTTSSAYYYSPLLSASYPSNAATVGMVSQGTADDTFLYECGMLIAYIPGGAPSDTGITPPTMVRM